MPRLTAFVAHQDRTVFDVMRTLTIDANKRPVGAFLVGVIPRFALNTSHAQLFIGAIFCQVGFLADEASDQGIVGTGFCEVSLLFALFAKQIWAIADVVVVATN